MTLSERIQSYLENGGFFNPEKMEHDKVRGLILDCRDQLKTTTQQLDLKTQEYEIICKVAAELRDLLETSTEQLNNAHCAIHAAHGLLAPFGNLS